MSEKHKRTIKQVIVLRTDLKNTKGEKIRTGKYIAQACHASMGVLTKYSQITVRKTSINIDKTVSSPENILKWFEEGFTKVCLKCNSEEELLQLYNQAENAGLLTQLITDSGFTEFDKPTNTCIAIGPDLSEEIDKITGHLNLF